MSQITEAESVALGEAVPLLRFASEHIKGLDQSLSLAIAKAIEAKQADQWNPTISQDFWRAFGKLCELISPVTMACLEAGNRDIDTRSFITFWRKPRKLSIAERTSRRYLMLLFVLLAVTTPPQLYVWLTSNLTKQLNDRVTELSVQSVRLSAEETNLKSASNLLTQLQKEQFVADVRTLMDNASRIYIYSGLLRRISYLQLREGGALGFTFKNNENDIFDMAQDATLRVEFVKGEALTVENDASLFSGMIVSFMLPILFGTIGALAYVIRLISDQIRSTTFSSTSPIRHLMRVMLGALMGVVITMFNGLSTQLSLPPLALAFIAGYGVEAVFSVFDGFVQKLRQQEPARLDPSQ